MSETGVLFVKGAKEHNLKNIDVEIPRGQLVVITGLSGSGKSSLAFDTIFAEGQRRYVESLSAYARQFLEQLQKPDVEYIEGLSPTISIEQKKGSSNPRSTVGTATEIYDYLRLMFARIGKPECHNCNIPITSQTTDQITRRIMKFPEKSKVIILSPLIRTRKGLHKEVFTGIQKQGFVRARVNGEIVDVSNVPELDKKKAHNIEAVVDRLVIKPDIRSRLAESIETAIKIGNGLVIVSIEEDKKWIDHLFSENLACPECGLTVGELTPRMFSFNSPYGACEQCGGLGNHLELDPDLIVPDKQLSIHEGAIQAWSKSGRGMAMYYNKILRGFCQQFNINAYLPYKNLDDDIKRILMNGTTRADEMMYRTSFEGVLPNLERRFNTSDSEYVKKKIHRYMSVLPCPSCNGQRLKPEALSVKVGGKNIHDITSFSILEAVEFFNNLKLNKEDKKIAEQILKELKSRLTFMVGVGLSYLTLSRSSGSLSGGESQRIRLASQIGSKLVGVCYVLDEPTIGLHQRDNEKLINTLVSLRDLGNTVLLVEHDEEVIRTADHIIDLGPGAGHQGGHIVAEGPIKDIIQSKNSITGKYLSGKSKIEVPKKRRKINSSQLLTITGACENNLKNINVEFPIECFTTVTGVSGSGKSTLVTKTLYPALARNLNNANLKPGKYGEIYGDEYLEKVIEIDQSPIGKTPRSNPATYTGIFDEIRKIFAKIPEAKIKGYTASRFSFNLKGGRCEACSGQGTKMIEMHFLPDIYVQCEECKGLRYNHETLEIKYKGMNIADVLDMQIADAHQFFRNFPKLKAGLRLLMDVGLGYLALGQPSTTLSGGEAQRIKLASELGRPSSGKTIYILDEPTTGLHFDDVHKLLEVLSRLTDRGNTIIVIEHNLDVIKSSDWVIDLGPEGGDEGGFVVATGTPEDISIIKESHTGQFLKKVLGNGRGKK